MASAWLLLLLLQRLQPDEKAGGWINLAPSRVIWEMMLYSPIDVSEQGLPPPAHAL